MTSSTAAQPLAQIATTPPPATGSLFSRSVLGRVLWTFRKEFFWVCVFSMFVNMLLLSPTLYMLQVFDRVLQSGSELTLVALTLIVVFFALVMGLADMLRSRLLVRSGGRFDKALSASVFAATYRAQLAGGGRMPQQPLNDLNQLRTFLTGNGVFAVVDTPWSIVYLTALFLMHPWLGWASIGFMIIQCTMAFLAHRYTRQQQKLMQERSQESAQYLHAKLRNAETVESMGMLDNLRVQWLGLNRVAMDSQALAQERIHRVQALTKFVQYTQQALMLALGAVLAIDGKISAGAMVASNALMGNALRPIGLIVGTWGQFIATRESFVRLEALLGRHSAGDAQLAAGELRGQVSLQDLVAYTPDRKAQILKGLNAEFKAGEVVVIMGPSGAGKSTLARCLLGIWPHTDGRVLLDGLGFDEWSREALGPQVGYLPQDIELFDGSIAENLARFADVPDATVVEAAQRTGIHDMILRLPKGYDTPIGEAGGLLSGGQRQRLGLARAILGNPKLVVLDEPSANLDDAGEAALLRTVQELKAAGTTVFMIVHQRHLIGVADRAMLLEAGQISKLLPVVVAPAGAVATPTSTPA